jgi:hypothetical protein
MATNNTGLQANQRAAQQRVNKPVKQPCLPCESHYLWVRFVYADMDSPVADTKTRTFHTRKGHSIAGPEKRATRAGIWKAVYDSPIAPGTYTMKLDFTKTDLRLWDFNFTAELRSA